MIEPTDEMLDELAATHERVRKAYWEARDADTGEGGLTAAEHERVAQRQAMAAALKVVELNLRASIARQIEYSLNDLGDEGWSRLADSAEEAGYERRTVLRRRQPENFTTLTIEAAYQHGYRRAARIARGAS